MPVNTSITLRKGSSSQWSTTNPVLASGEPGYDTTNNILKIGNGAVSWSGLTPINSISNLSNPSGYLTKWEGSNFSKSTIFERNTGSSDRHIGIGTVNPTGQLDIRGINNSRIVLSDGDINTRTLTATQQISSSYAYIKGGEPADPHLNFIDISGDPVCAIGGSDAGGYINFFTKTALYDGEPAMEISEASNLLGQTFYTLSVAGNIEAEAKYFKIKHPDPSSEFSFLQYGSLESPYNGIRLTGQGKLTKGVCIVELPSYISYLIEEKNINIQLTNKKHHKILFIDNIDISNNRFTVKGHRCKTLGPLEFFWTFTGVRKDIDPLVVEH